MLAIKTTYGFYIAIFVGGIEVLILIISACVAAIAVIFKPRIGSYREFEDEEAYGFDQVEADRHLNPDLDIVRENSEIKNELEQQVLGTFYR